MESRKEENLGQHRCEREAAEGERLEGGTEGRNQATERHHESIKDKVKTEQNG